MYTNTSYNIIMYAYIYYLTRWFHHSFRADEWLLYECETPIASLGRGLVIGRFYTLQGKLVVSCVQEAYFHINDWNSIKHRQIENNNNRNNDSNNTHTTQQQSKL